MSSRVLWMTAALLAMAAGAQGVEPVDKDLIPEGRAILDYLESIYGQKTLAGGNGTKGIESIRSVCGKEPAIVTFDLSGWNSPPFDFAAAFKPGTKAHQELMRDLKGHADYLEQLITHDELPTLRNTK